MTDFEDISAVHAVISAKREASKGNNSLVVTKSLEPLLAAVLRLTVEVTELRHEVKRLRYRQSVSNGKLQSTEMSGDDEVGRAFPSR